MIIHKKFCFIKKFMLLIFAVFVMFEILAIHSNAADSNESDYECKLNIDGKSVTFITENGNTYYYVDDVLQLGWQTIGGKEYYFYSNGSMAVSTYIGKYYVDANGVYKK